MVTKPNGELFTFVQSETGLQYFDTSKHCHDHQCQMKDENVFMVNTVAHNKSKYVKNGYLGAITGFHQELHPLMSCRTLSCSIHYKSHTG